MNGVVVTTGWPNTRSCVGVGADDRVTGGVRSRFVNPVHALRMIARILISKEILDNLAILKGINLYICVKKTSWDTIKDYPWFSR